MPLKRDSEIMHHYPYLCISFCLAPLYVFLFVIQCGRLAVLDIHTFAFTHLDDTLCKLLN